METLVDLLDDNVATGSERHDCATFSVDALDIGEGLKRVSDVWRLAVTHAGSPDWPVVRFEAVTSQEQARAVIVT